MTRKERSLRKIKMKFNSIQCWPNSHRLYIWGENPPQLSQQILLVRTFVTYSTTLSFQHYVAILNKKSKFFFFLFQGLAQEKITTVVNCSRRHPHLNWRQDDCPRLHLLINRVKNFLVTKFEKVEDKGTTASTTVILTVAEEVVVPTVP